MAEGHHGLREQPGIGDVTHERAAADLHVKHQRRGALGDLLGHDGTGDERDRLNRPCHVAQCVQPPVSGGQPGPGGTDHAAGLPQHGEHLGGRERGLPARNGLQLVQSATGMTEAPAGQLRDRRAATRNQRRENQRDLVADSASGVLVHGRPTRRAEVETLPGVHHGRGPCPQFRLVQAAEIDGHQQRGHLLVGHLAAQIGVDQPADLRLGERRAIPFGPDQLDGVMKHGVLKHGVTHRCFAAYRGRPW